MRLLLIAGAALCATSALAAELPISGIYGDELGCARLNMGPNDIDEPGGFNLYADRFEGYEWGCTFGEVWPYGDGRTFGVQGLCGAEGTPFVEQYVIERAFDDENRYTVYEPDGGRQFSVGLCEGAAETPGGKG
ncbi:MAG: hypothetical protein AB8B88_05185 [Devosiaceae bacterium]